MCAHNKFASIHEQRWHYSALYDSIPPSVAGPIAQNRADGSRVGAKSHRLPFGTPAVLHEKSRGAGSTNKIFDGGAVICRTGSGGKAACGRAGITIGIGEQAHQRQLVVELRRAILRKLAHMRLIS